MQFKFYAQDRKREGSFIGFIMAILIGIVMIVASVLFEEPISSTIRFISGLFLMIMISWIMFSVYEKYLSKDGGTTTTETIEKDGIENDYASA